jgi:hypothetical protein
MKEYRIVKETETYTKSVSYCIQVKKKKLLRRELWVTYYYYDTYVQAKDKVGRLTQEITREVVE